MNETSLKQLIQSLFPKQDDIIVGMVTNLHPLTVKDMSDDKLEIKPLYGRSVTTMIASGTLEVGNEVLMLSYKGGKKYFVLDKRA